MSDAICDAAPVDRPRRWWKPRAETCVLLIGLGFTIYGKWLALRHLRVQNFPGQLARVVLPDAVFFASVVLFIHLCHLLKPSRWTARAALLIAAVLATWSVLNTEWLIESGVQLQLGVVKLFLLDAAQLWPLVKPHLKSHQPHVVGLLTLVLASGGVLVWFLVRPGDVLPLRRYHARRAGAAAAITAALMLAGWLAPPGHGASSDAAMLGFSSHRYALVSAVTGTFESQHRHVPERKISLVGERIVPRRDPAPTPPPNVLLVVLESASRVATSLDDPERATTPYLARLAAEGVDFRQTRVPVSHTTKALWAILAGSDPVIRDNYVEAVLADQAYESLPTILARYGYRSAFFQMSKGNFECAPGLASNLGFDWVWFRENLGDPSAHLGYLSGDDFRMIQPAFDWARQQGGPFLLMMVTSASHEPFVVPEWFGNIEGTRYEKYLHSMRYTDQFLAEVDKVLAERGLADNTILCVIGDHGTSFRPSTGKGGGRLWPYEEVIHVPWIIRWPNGLLGGRKLDAPCSQLDVAPTILSLLGMDLSRAGYEGIDALAEPEGSRPRRFHFSSWYDRYPMGFVEGSRKVIYDPYRHLAYEYDLSSDPGETLRRELAPEQVDSIGQEMLHWQEHSRVRFPPKRFRQRLLYSHWQTFCTGDSAWAYYVP